MPLLPVPPGSRPGQSARHQADRVPAASDRAAAHALVDLQRSRRLQQVRGAVTALAAAAVLVTVPVLDVGSYLDDQHLRHTRAAVDLPVSHVEVHRGKDAWVEVDVATGPGVGDGSGTAYVDVDHPPVQGQLLPVVLDPADPSRAVLASPRASLTSTWVEALGLAGLFDLFIVIVGWGPHVPPRAARRAGRDLLRRAGHDGTVPPARLVTILSVRTADPPLSWLRRELSGTRTTRFIAVELLPAEESPLIGHYLLSAHADLHAGQVVLASETSRQAAG